MAEIITPRYEYIPQAEAYPPEEWTWRGIIYPGVFEGTTSFIQYKFDSIKRDLATGATYYTNYGTDGLHFNAPAQASNHVWLNGTDQSVDLPIQHDLGVELASDLTTWEITGDDGANTGDTTVDTLTINQVNTSSVVYVRDTTILEIGKTYQLIYTQDMISGTGLRFDMDGQVNILMANPSPMTFIADRTAITFYRNTTPSETTLSGISVKEVTNTNSYATYYDVDTQAFKTIGEEEFVVNGNFDTDLSDWSVTKPLLTVWENSSVRMNDGVDTSHASLSQDNIFKDSKTYIISFEIVEEGTIGTGVRLQNVDASLVTTTETTLGVHTFTGTQPTGLSEILYISARSGWNGRVDNVSVKEVLPVGTTYNLTDSFSSYFTTDVPVTEADRSYLTTNPEALYSMWFEEPVVGLSFSKANMINFVPGTEGLQAGSYLQDIAAPLGVELCGDVNFDDPSYWLATANSSVADGEATINAVTTYEYVRSASDIAGLEIGKFYNMETNIIDMVTGEGRVRIQNATIENSHKFSSAGLFGTIVYFDTGSPRIALERSETVTEFTASSFSIRENTGVYEITNYLNTCRTTLATTNYGASNFAMVQDGSGRTTGMGLANTQNFPPYDDGRYASTGFKPNLPVYSIEETVTGELQDFGSELNSAGNISLVNSDEVTTFTRNGPYGCDLAVTTIGTSISNPRLQKALDVSTVIGSTYIVSFNAVVNSGTPVIYQYILGTDTTVVNQPVVNGGNTITIQTTTAGGLSRMYFDGRDLFDVSITNWSVKELTTKTQRTEQRLLTHTDSHLGVELLTNTTFVDDTNLVPVGTPSLSFNNNIMSVEVLVNPAPYVREDITTEIGKSYLMSCDIDNGTLTGVNKASISVRDSTNAILEIVGTGDTEGIVTLVFTATTTESRICYNNSGTASSGEMGHFTNPSIKEVSTENKYYIDGLEQAVTPSLPDPLVDIDLNNTAITGYPDTIDSRLGNFEIHDEVLIP